MFRVALFTVLASFCVIANATPDGNWKGKAVYSDSDGYTETINELNLSIVLKDDQLTVSDTGNWTLMPGAVTVKGTDLFYNDAKVGSFTKEALMVTDIDAGDGVMYSLSLKIDATNGTATFKDAAKYKDDHSDGVEGTLTQAR